MKRHLWIWLVAVAACSPAMKQAEQRVLNVADAVCAIDAIDPTLPPAEAQAAIAAACGAVPDLHKIVEAQSRSLSRASARAILRATPCASAAPATPASSR